MRDFTNDIKEVRRRLDEAKGYLRIDTSRVRLVELEAEIGRPDLWDDQENAKRVNTEYANAKSDVDQYDRLTSEIDDLEVLSEMAREEGDESQEPEIEAGIASIGRELGTLELRSLFTGDHDANDVIVQINAKDGGVDAQDWA
ncbi:MAG: peptide chain release factor 2, partial [Actinomycetota bacterium]